MNNAEKFMKRLYGVQDFYRMLSDMLLNIKDMRMASRAKRVSREFSERIMMAVTDVNGCRYCSYYHTKVALKAGMDKKEIQQLLTGEFGDAPKEEIAALYFAQHYAESGGNPHPDAVQCLIDTYGSGMAHDIKAYIRAIMVGNAWGNMLDAFRLRLKGKPCQKTTLRDEVGVVFGVIVMIPMAYIKSWAGNISIFKIAGKT
jgi:AhpD family alkylhydroperoxidase